MVSKVTLAPVAYRAHSLGCVAPCAYKEIEFELGCLGIGIVTFAAASHYVRIFNSLVAAFGVKNEWWDYICGAVCLPSSFS